MVSKRKKRTLQKKLQSRCRANSLKDTLVYFVYEEDDLLIEYFKHLNKSMYLYNDRYVDFFNA